MTQTSVEERLQQQKALEILYSRHFLVWLASIKASLLVTSYHAHKLLAISASADKKPILFARNIPRCMGFALEDNGFYVSSQHQIVRFVNKLAPGEMQQGYDRVFLPQVSYLTSDLDTHDMGVTAEGKLVFVNTLYNCLSTVSTTHSFKPLWKPPFIDKLTREDRCHLNGLAMVAGQAKYVTAVSTTNIAEGWRDHKATGGVVIDVETDDIICRNLSMPHSPRWYQEKLWLLDAGSGYFGYVQDAAFVPLTFCPGFLRGMSFIDHYAIVGLSNLRESHLSRDTALSQNLRQAQVSPRCALYVIDINTGDVVHWLQFNGWLQEIYDIGLLLNSQKPMLIGFETDEINQISTFNASSI